MAPRWSARIEQLAVVGSGYMVVVEIEQTPSVEGVLGLSRVGQIRHLERSEMDVVEIRFVVARRGFAGGGR